MALLDATATVPLYCITDTDGWLVGWGSDYDTAYQLATENPYFNGSMETVVLTPAVAFANYCNHDNPYGPDYTNGQPKIHVTMLVASGYHFTPGKIYHLPDIHLTDLPTSEVCYA